jgi:NADH-quinone oxidoreductase subunit G
VISVSCFDNASTLAADIVIPAETYPEKEGTVTHPDGRLQRLRPAIPHPGEVRPVWQALAELAARLGDETGIGSPRDALAVLAAAAPFYAGLTPEEIGGRGIRWQEREPASRFEATAAEAGPGPVATNGAGELRLGTYRDLWAGEITDRNVALRFLAPSQRLELAVGDGERLGLRDGDEVEVRSNGSRVTARVALRSRIRPGAAYLIEGTATENANVLAGAETVEVTKIGTEAAAGSEEAPR